MHPQLALLCPARKEALNSHQVDLLGRLVTPKVNQLRVDLRPTRKKYWFTPSATDLVEAVLHASPEIVLKLIDLGPGHVTDHFGLKVE